MYELPPGRFYGIYLSWSNSKNFLIMTDTQKIVLAGVVGAAAGAIAGILLAPESGSDTRQKLTNSLDGLTGNLDELRQKGKEMIDHLRASGDEMVSRTKSNGQNVGSKMNS